MLSTLVFGLKNDGCVHRFVQETRTNFSHIFGFFFLQLFVVQLLHDDDENEANFVHKVGPNFSFEFIEAKIV